MNAPTRAIAWTIAIAAVVAVVIFGATLSLWGEFWTAAVAGTAFLAGRASVTR